MVKRVIYNWDKPLGKGVGAIAPSPPGSATDMTWLPGLLLANCYDKPTCQTLGLYLHPLRSYERQYKM